MKKSNTKFMGIALVILLAITITTGASLAWFAASKNTISTEIDGGLVDEYFHCGTGTEEDPFVITRPLHYYHLVEFFQRTTSLPVVYRDDESGNLHEVQFGSDYLYFQIGCPLAQLADKTNREAPTSEDDWYVFDYLDNGTCALFDVDDSGEVRVGDSIYAASKTLNMIYYSGERALMPLGSSEIPFIGYIDGHNMTVSNLNIVSHSTVTVTKTIDGEKVTTPNVPRHTCDMGIFGCVGQGVDLNGNDEIKDYQENNVTTHEQTTIQNIYFTNAIIDLEGTNASTVTAEGISTDHQADYHKIGTDGEIDMEAGIPVAFVGYIAGHVYSTENIQDIYINNCSIVGGSGALNRYGFFGLVIDPTTGEAVSALGSEIANMYKAGDNAGFGGSINMTDLYTRITNLYKNTATAVYDITKEIVIYDEVTDEYKRVAVNYNNNTTKSKNNYTIKYYYSPDSGSYYLFEQTNNNSFNYLYGENNKVTKTVMSYIIKKDPNSKEYLLADAWIVKDGEFYLGYNNALIGTDESSAIKLVFDDNQHLYFICDVHHDQRYDYPFNDDSGNIETVFYLNANSARSGVTADENGTTAWQIDGSHNNALYTEYNGVKYYLNYDDGWFLSPYFDFYTFSAEGGNYLRLDGTNIINTTNSTQASKFELVTSGNTTKISKVINGTRYYLVNNTGRLDLSTSDYNNTWYYDNEKGAYYVLFNDTKAYLVYYNNTWVLGFDGKKIQDGNNHYLTATGTTTFNNTNDLISASTWILDSNATKTTIATFYNGTKVYLGINNGNLAIGTQYGSVQWTYDQGKLYINQNGIDFYLVYDNSWKVRYNGVTISNGSNYLSINNNAIGNQTNATNATIWGIDGTSIYAFANGAKKYLGVANNALVLADTATAWTRNGNTYSTKINGDTFYLVYDAGWKINFEGYVIKDSSGNNYLNANGTASFNNQTSNTNASRWIMNYSAASTSIATYYNGTKVYLGVNAGELALGAGYSGTIWQKDNNGYYVEQNGIRLYLTYRYSAWRLLPKDYVTFSKGNLYMYIYSTTAVRNTNTATNATKFYKDTNNHYYGFFNNTKYYLRNNGGTVQVSDNVNNAVVLFVEDEGIYYSNGTTRYYLKQDSTSTNSNTAWSFTAPNGMLVYITDGKGNYLRFTGTNNNSFGNATNKSEASIFLITSKTSTTIRWADNTARYLQNNSGALRNYTSSTTWTINTGNGSITSTHRSGRNTYTDYLMLSGTTWSLSTTPGNAYFEDAVGYDQVVQSSVEEYSQTYTPVTFTTKNQTTTEQNAESLTFTPFVINTPNTNHFDFMQSTSNGKSKVIEFVETQTKVNSGFATFIPIRVAVSGDEDYDASNPNKTSTKNTGYIIAGGNYSSPSNEGDIRVSRYALSNIEIYTKNSMVRISDGNGHYLMINQSRNGITNGDEASATYWIKDTNDRLYYQNGNTSYYLRNNNGSLTITQNEYYGTRWTLGTNRIYSGTYNIVYSNDAWGLSTTTTNVSYETNNMLYTVDASGNRLITFRDIDGYLSYSDRYDSETKETFPGAKTQFDEMIKTNADGLHFMNATISKNRLVTLPQATIFGTTYTNYQMPQDCIDFKVLRRGAISFFSGTYFSGNTAFFSLHQIFRDKQNDIEEIKEISKVYKHIQSSGGNMNYIYEYSDGKYGAWDEKNTTKFYYDLVFDDSRMPTFNETNFYQYYTLAFDTSWITNPTDVETENKVYYFEIPCNAGEYALGSVEGKEGAYLLYLDIAANGGDEVSSVVSGQGNTLTSSFKVDFRAPGETSPHAIMQFAVNAPADEGVKANRSIEEYNKANYSVRVVFDSTEHGDSNQYSQGIYNIYVTNKVEGATINLDVYLVDNDNDASTLFPFAYRVIYTNNSTEGPTIISNVMSMDFFQSVSSFSIPSSGDAVETSYK